ncbi:hypothetical protein KAH94_04675 [bacterium]|nr:hypothetical protein [bacterium]
MKKFIFGFLALSAGFFGGVWGVTTMYKFESPSKKGTAPSEAGNFTMKMICTDDWSEPNWYQAKEEKLYESHNVENKKVFYIGTYSSPKMKKVKKKWKLKRSSFLGVEPERKCRLYFVMKEEDTKE